MPFTLTMPKLSPTMEEGTITKWRKKEGDHVKAGDVLFEVATDKATVEHSALDAGWLRKILVQEGESAIVNQAIAIFTEEKNESIDGYQPEGALPHVAAPTQTVEETQKEKPAEKPREALKSGFLEPAFVPEPPLAHYTFKVPVDGLTSRTPASPLAKKLAREKGIDLSTVKGSGPGGRIMQRDLDLGQPSTPVTFGRRETPSIAPGTYEEIPLSPMRKIIGQRLQEAKTFIPHFYCTQDILVDRLISVRSELSAGGLKVSFNDFIVRATALTLREHPNINAGFNSVSKTMIRFKTIDIAIAVSLESGLITPIVRHADYKNIGYISQEIKSLAARAREGKLSREEYVGGSFTISNLGMYGISEFSAIINPPQAAILAVAGIEDRPIVREGHIVSGKVMKLTLSGDHRVIDGVDGAKFLKSLQKLLENPSLLLL